MYRPEASEPPTVGEEDETMPKGHRPDIRKLEKKVTEVSKALAKVGSADDFREFILLTRRSGWTTPAEFIFSLGIAESMLSQVEVLEKMKSVLLSGGKAVK